MFTGLVETVGQVAEVSALSGMTRIGFTSEIPVTELEDGESIAVDGVCLTVAARRGDRFFVDAVAETLSNSTLGRLRPGHRVNLERALRLGQRLGGHLVSGHVDGTVRVAHLKRSGGDCRLRLTLGKKLARYVALKGSVAIQGVSLTVAALDSRGFEVALVPHTLERTGLGTLRPGDEVNLEVDLLARYLERLTGGTGG